MSTVENDVGIESAGTGGTVSPASGRAPRISEADVFAAADALLVEGRRPTIDRVRMRLGRGSPNTINDHLDTWWAKLGARLRDLPGQEFPQLPERVAQSLQRLWNEALQSAHEILNATLAEREAALFQREQTVNSRAQQLVEHEQAVEARAAGLETSLALAREQLGIANQRAQGLEGNLQEREADCARLRTRMEVLETSCADARTKIDAAAAAHLAERRQLLERHAEDTRHWQLEVDRSRQLAKEAAKEHERQVKALRSQLEALQDERDGLQEELREVRAEVKTAAAVREQLEQRLRAAEQSALQRAAKTSAKAKRGPRLKRPLRASAGTRPRGSSNTLVPK